MKQKYLILRNDENFKLVIREFAELDKEMFTFLCEETFNQEAVTSAISLGQNALMAILRTKNLFPIGSYAKKIAAAVTKIYEPGNDPSVELVFDDHALMKKEQEEPLVHDDLEDEVAEIDELLDEEPDLSDYDEKNEIEHITYSLKIDNDSSDGEADD
jgi:hypothetical protein